MDARIAPLRPSFFFGAPYGFGVDPALQSKTPGVIAPTPPEPTPAPPPPTGILKLDVEPAQLAQVFVDGEYMGTPADLDNQLELTPGTHRIEIRARGYETLTFDARVVAGRTITYRETLSRVDLAPRPGGDTGKSGGTGVAAGAAVMPDTNPTSRKTTFYFIPGCYLGNVPPTEVKLPANCDFSRMITHTP